MNKIGGLFVGLSTIDLIFKMSQFPQEDSKSTAGDYTIAAGGPATNAAVAFAHLGGQPTLLSCLGTSSISSLAKRDLEECGVEHYDLRKGEAEPAISSIVVVPISGTRTIVTTPAIDAGPDFVISGSEITSLIEKSNIILVDGHLSQLAGQVLKVARKRGVTTVMDGDIFQPSMEKFLPFVDVVIFGRSFMPDKVPSVSIDSVGTYLEGFGVATYIATQGPGEVVVMQNGIKSSFRTSDVTAVDTLGAGDFFHGAFCWYYSGTNDIADSVQRSITLAEKTIQSFGTRKWLGV